jgi:trimeric autotransporter adhesin
MNKVYRSIWNRALGAFVATSELDRSCGKGRSGAGAAVCDGRSDQRGGLGASTRRAPDSRVMTMLLLIGVGGWGAQAQAQVNCATSPFNAYNGSSTCAGFESTASGAGFSSRQ